MKYVITKQIAVEAESPEDAVAKIDTGKTISFTVTERPGQAVPQVMVGRTSLTPTGTPP